MRFVMNVPLFLTFPHSHCPDKLAFVKPPPGLQYTLVPLTPARSAAS